MVKQFLTCKFKIHNPSRSKRDVMDYALYEYTLTYTELLDWAQANLEIITSAGEYKNRMGKIKYTGKSIARLLPRPRAQIHSSAIDSLIQDVAGNLASYLELSKLEGKTSFLTCRDPNPEADTMALEHFIEVGSDVEDFNQSQARYLATVRGSVMPLYFCRGDAAAQTKTGAPRNRNFSLLLNAKKKQLLAVLYLLPAGHEMCKALGAASSNLIRLDTGEIFVSNSKTAIFVPLQLGRNGWQEQRFLDVARAGQAVVKTAFLVRDDDAGEYFLHVSFRMACPERYEPKSYLGIDKGVLFTAAYAVVDAEGQVLTLGHFDDELRALQIKHGRTRERLARNGKKITRQYYKRQAYENILHSLTNHLIDLAKEHQAQIVVEDLNIRVRGGRVVSRFRKLDNILSYKCRLAGIPYRSVFAAYSSQICHKCGAMMERDNRLVVCNECSYNGHSDDNAAVNIARRALYKKSEWKDGGYRAFHRSFAKDGTL